jgi:hypothetical protein
VGYFPVGNSKTEAGIVLRQHPRPASCLYAEAEQVESTGYNCHSAHRAWDIQDSQE